MNPSHFADPEPVTSYQGQLNLLVVEDDQGLNRLIQRHLRRHGLHVEGVLSGAEAIQRTATLTDPLLLLDYRLPDMTAKEIVLTLQHQQRPAPFIVMTGNGDERIAVEMMKLGARDYLTKSETFLDLLPTVVQQAIQQITTERRLQQAERALRESEHRFSLLFQYIPFGIGLTDLDGQILIANQPLLDLCGYSQEEFQHLHIGTLFADQSELVALYAGTIRPLQLTLLRKDGTHFQASCSYNRTDVSEDQTFLLVVEDMTADIATQQRIHHLNAVLNGIRRVNRLIAEVSDRNRLIQEACDSLIQTFGYQNAWIVRTDSQRHILAIASAGMSQPIRHNLDHDQVMPWCSDQVSEPNSVLVMHQQENCRDCPLNTICAEQDRLVSQLTYNGKNYGVMSVGVPAGFVEDAEDQSLFAELARDLAFALYKIDVEDERGQAERDLQHSQQLLTEALDALEQRVAERTRELSIANLNLAHAARVKDEFLANMSHELRTPLNAILGRTEMCLDGFYGPLSDGATKALHTIEESGRHLLELINDVLDVAKIESGHADLELQLIAVDEVCAASLRLISQQALKKHIHINQEIDPQVDLIHADARRIKQILINLLNNAVKFTPQGGNIGLTVTGDREQDLVHFIVWDTGIGIAPDQIGRLFQPFTQIDSSLSRAHEGTGLGLHLVASLVRLHGGSVQVESTLGTGSRFSFMLPWKRVNAESNANNLSKYISPTLPVAASEQEIGKLLLLADDNTDTRELLSHYLTQKGFRVITARHGLEAVRMANTEHPDLILMDVQMPQLDGLAATRLIREMPALHNVPIIALTALVMPGDRERCLAAGANDYLTKPVPLSQLLKLIHFHLKP
ncbi:multi-sensor hybrid histidine kinase [Oscillochloris trichoides DG-6]|uniref:Circadian input-output histidine kinase CikA n=1 Tax=Oscillochloris trichoides DG-6 TaxID=765420 RepID=E1IFX0_9CHLR|nr:response regulator [Oscillochloris trichoides]EFO79928.1 multi-sensor hybrid histidine kinase [Oscillochloris trichoides DG-6]